MTFSRFSKIAAVSCIALTAVSPAMARTEFRGGGVIGSYSGCEANGFPANSGNTVVGRYTPGGLPGNSATEDMLSLSYNTYAFHFRFPAGWSYGTPVTVTWIATIGGGGGAWVPNNTVTLTFLAPPPFAEADSTDRYLNFLITNLDDLAGCSAVASVFMHQI
ncbi:MAG: hypothetical protein H6899_16950 [Rhodobacter sp.]|nr:hypothetical protein [Rhodobacter sp.]